jgi:hypothetical protein
MMMTTCTVCGAIPTRPKTFERGIGPFKLDLCATHLEEITPTIAMFVATSRERLARVGVAPVV